MVSKEWGPLAVAFVWFTTHFGGGFASGRQLVDFFVGYGWYAAFTPVLAILIVGFVLYYAWEFSFIHKAYDYREWMDKFFRPYEIFFSNAFEVMYLMILLIASAVAVATGGTVMQQLLGTGYVMNTVIVAVCIFFLTIFGAEVVRRAATAMALLIIIGMLIIYVANLFVNLPQLIGVLRSAPSPKGFGEAFWAMSKYIGFQACAMGAYIAVADALMSHEDVKKAFWYGVIVNAGVLWLATLGVLAHYPTILAEKVPVLYVAAHGGGGQFGTGIVSLLIFLAVVSTGVSLIYGGARRIVGWWGRTHRGSSERTTNVIASLAYVLITWAIALFGLLPLIAKGYGYLGSIAIFLLVIPILFVGLFRSGSWKAD